MLNMLFLTIYTVHIFRDSNSPLRTQKSRLPGANHVPKGTEYNFNPGSKTRGKFTECQGSDFSEQMMVTFCYFWSHIQSRQPILYSSYVNSK